MVVDVRSTKDLYSEDHNFFGVVVKGTYSYGMKHLCSLGALMAQLTGCAWVPNSWYSCTLDPNPDGIYLRIPSSRSGLTPMTFQLYVTVHRSIPLLSLAMHTVTFILIFIVCSLSRLCFTENYSDTKQILIQSPDDSGPKVGSAAMTTP